MDAHADIDTTLFAKGQKIESDIDLWHKRIGHVNYRRLEDLQTKQVVFSLPKFSGPKAQICEACQLEKQHRLLFLSNKTRAVTSSIFSTRMYGERHKVLVMARVDYT